MTRERSRTRLLTVLVTGYKYGLPSSKTSHPRLRIESTVQPTSQASPTTVITEQIPISARSPSSRALTGTRADSRQLRWRQRQPRRSGRPPPPPRPRGGSAPLAAPARARSPSNGAAVSPSAPSRYWVTASCLGFSRNFWASSYLISVLIHFLDYY
jgi:hypothetical protein